MAFPLESLEVDVAPRADHIDLAPYAKSFPTRFIIRVPPWGNLARKRRFARTAGFETQPASALNVVFL
jgi:hypothetical protein